MIDKWTIRANPDKKDANRCLVLLKTDMKDLQKVIRKVGMKGGRPVPSKANPFNFELVLKEADIPYRDDLKEFLRQISKPDAEVAENGAATAVASAPAAAPAPAAPAYTPPPVQAAPAPAAPAYTPPPVAHAAPAPAAPAYTPPPAPAPASISASAPLSAPPPVAEPEPEALPEGPQLIPASPPEFLIIQRPKSDFESFIVGPFNRFAHAACMSVVDSPGSMYNPLVVSGEPGSGKSHILNSMAIAMGKKSKVVLTDAVRMAEIANKGGLAEAVKDCNVLLIDDVHLLATVEVKTGAIATVLREFIGANKQIVLGSLFPPRMMTGVEGILGFDLARGSAVELKAAPPPARKSIFLETSKRGSVRLGDPEWDSVEKMPQADMLALVEDLRRFKTFKPDTDQKKLLPLLLAGAGTSDAGAAAGAAGYTPPETAPAIMPLGLMFPSGSENQALYQLSKIMDAAKEHDVPIGFRIVHKKAYDSGQAAGLPAQLAKEARAAGVASALVIGPAAGSALAGREREFANLVQHTLQSNAISTAFIPLVQVGLAGISLRALLNLQE